MELCTFASYFQHQPSKMESFNVLSFLFCSYLADQCWNGGFIYLIMLRRIKRKAPLPPSNGNNSNSSEPKARPTSESSGKTAQNGKRTRKFGVITRTSSGGKESKASKSTPKTEHENGHCALTGMDRLQPEAPRRESSAEDRLHKVDSPFPVGQYRSRLSDGGILDLNASELSLQVSKGLFSLELL